MNEHDGQRDKKTHRGRRSSASQTILEQRYFLGSFAFAWLARNHGSTSCGPDPANDGNERTTRAERRSCRTSETTSGSPQECWSGPGGTNELVESRNTSGCGIGPGKAGASASAARTLHGETGPGRFVPVVPRGRRGLASVCQQV